MSIWYVAAHLNYYLSVIVKETMNKHVASLGLEKENVVSNHKTSLLCSPKYAAWSLAS